MGKNSKILSICCTLFMVVMTGMFAFMNIDVNAQTRPTIEWADIPAGKFLMGDSKEMRAEDEYKDAEAFITGEKYDGNMVLKSIEQIPVNLSAFKISKYEITFEQYDLFCSATGRAKPNDNGWGRGKLPVINVSWNDAKAFADWRGCRLPTEAEWEYACKASTNNLFYTGDCLNPIDANFNATKGNLYSSFLCDNAISTNRGKSLPVGSFKPNKWGLYDMHGNVNEFCSDYYAPLPKTPQNNPTGPATGRFLVFRGGSWKDEADGCKSGARGYVYGPDITDNKIGFRVVFKEDSKYNQGNSNFEGNNSLMQNLKDISGTWKRSDGFTWNIMQNGNVVVLKNSSNSFSHEANCKYLGNNIYNGVLSRTTRSSNCITKLSIKVEVLPADELKISCQALDENCDIKISYSEAFIYSRQKQQSSSENNGSVQTSSGTGITQKYWNHSRGYFAKVNSDWNEYDSEKQKQINTFKENERTDEYIKIYDPSRNMYLKLTNNSCLLWDNNKKDWFILFRGSFSFEPTAKSNQEQQANTENNGTVQKSSGTGITQKYWNHSRGYFAKVNSDWNEYDSEKQKLINTFKENERTNDYIKIYDPSRNMYLKLTNNSCLLWDNNKKDWFVLFNGSFSSEPTGSAKTEQQTKNNSPDSKNKNGSFIEYYSNGKKKIEYLYKDGELINILNCWTIEGRLLIDVICDSLQKMKIHDAYIQDSNIMDAIQKKYNFQLNESYLISKLVHNCPVMRDIIVMGNEVELYLLLGDKEIKPESQKKLEIIFNGLESYLNSQKSINAEDFADELDLLIEKEFNLKKLEKTYGAALQEKLHLMIAKTSGNYLYHFEAIEEAFEKWSFFEEEEPLPGYYYH